MTGWLLLVGWRLYVGCSSFASGEAAGQSVHLYIGRQLCGLCLTRLRQAGTPFCSILYSERVAVGGFDIFPYKSYKSFIMGSFRLHNKYGFHKVIALHSGNLKVFLIC